MKDQRDRVVAAWRTAVTGENKFPLRRVIAAAHRAMRAYGWTRRQAVRFALNHYRAGTLSESISYTPKFQPRREMPGEVQEQLTHRRRSMARR